MDKKTFLIIAIFVLATLGHVAYSKPPEAKAYPVHGVNMPRVGTVDQRCQSFNVETVADSGGLIKDNLART